MKRQNELPPLQKTDPIQVEVVSARLLDLSVCDSWKTLRAANPTLWSPYFDIRMFDMLAKFAPNPHLAIVRRQNQIVALFPFQGTKSGLARPLGTPLSDQHDLIQAFDGRVELSDVLKAIGLSGFVFTGLRHEVKDAVKSQMSLCHVADLSDGVDGYTAWRKANWNDQVKKNERRKRQGERQWGPMRLEIASPTTSTHFETLMAWKQAKYVETNRHNVLAVPWINAYLRALYNSPDPEFVGEITLLYFGDLKWLGLFGQVNRFYKWVAAAVMPQPGLVGAG